MIFEDILSKIEEYDTITIFRHQHPDCDAMGSQNGLANWIKDNYPEKHVFRCGLEQCNQGIWPELEVVSDEIIQSSLAIVCDCADVPRIDDERIQLAKYIIKIDHHPNRDPYGDLLYVVEEAAATCEILTLMFAEMKDKIISDQTAEYLYKGLLTDTLCYRTTNTTENTLKAGAILATHHINIPEINRELFDLDYSTFKFTSFLRQKVQYNGHGFAYIIFNMDDLKDWNLTPTEAKNHIDEMGHVKEFEVWAIFSEDEENPGKYNGSLRSKHVVVNQLANKYHGGGHANASGVNKLTSDELKAILYDLEKLAKDYVESKN
ncbi:MAG: bifunctional oligoribonuclease/PAP phosphatase NrnA [Solobacterium sp.]|nr:bifunctional oligoribonuclease/PAP phosphatase NrnA [Solobacterium sp.]